MKKTKEVKQPSVSEEVEKLFAQQREIARRLASKEVKIIPSKRHKEISPLDWL